MIQIIDFRTPMVWQHYTSVVNLMGKVDLTDLGISKHMTPDGVATLTYLAESIQEKDISPKILAIVMSWG